MMVFFTPKLVGAFIVNFNANLKLFLRQSNCASVGGKNFDNYQDERQVRGKNSKTVMKLVTNW